MLADVPQEGDDVELAGPVEVVGDPRTRVEIHEARHLCPDPLHPALDHLPLVQGAFVRLEARVTDEPGGTPDQGDGGVAGELEPPQGQQRYETADVQAVRRRIEAAIKGAGPGLEMVAERIRIGALVDQTAPGQVFEEGLRHQ